jgi:hypothetical protein
LCRSSRYRLLLNGLWYEGLLLQGSAWLVRQVLLQEVMLLVNMCSCLCRSSLCSTSVCRSSQLHD